MLRWVVSDETRWPRHLKRNASEGAGLKLCAKSDADGHIVVDGVRLIPCKKKDIARNLHKSCPRVFGKL